MAAFTTLTAFTLPKSTRHPASQAAFCAPVWKPTNFKAAGAHSISIRGQFLASVLKHEVISEVSASTVIGTETRGGSAKPAAVLPFRIGHGFDLHRLEPNLPLIIGGINIPHDRGCEAHSDGDVLLHCVVDAILGALSLPDIGQLFPDNDPKWKGAPSSVFVKEAAWIILSVLYFCSKVEFRKNNGRRRYPDISVPHVQHWHFLHSFGFGFYVEYAYDATCTVTYVHNVVNTTC